MASPKAAYSRNQMDRPVAATKWRDALRRVRMEGRAPSRPHGGTRSVASAWRDALRRVRIRAQRRAVGNTQKTRRNVLRFFRGQGIASLHVVAPVSRVGAYRAEYRSAG